MHYLYIVALFLFGFLTGKLFIPYIYRVVNKRLGSPLLRSYSPRGKFNLKYFLSEVLTGLLWVAAYFQFGFTMRLFYGLFFISILVVLSTIDYYTKTIPNNVLIPAIILSVISLLLYVFKLETLPILAGSGVLWSIAGFIMGGGFLLIIATIAPLIFRKEVMGGGDIKLAAFIGLYLGVYVFVVLLISSMLSSIVGLTLILLGKKSTKDIIPFGPFLALGSILVIFFGPEIWHVYP